MSHENVLKLISYHFRMYLVIEKTKIALKKRKSTVFNGYK